MTGHYFLIGIIIAVIIFFQLKVYFRTSKKRKQFNSIFPDKAEEEWLVLKNEGVQIVSKQKVVANESIRIAKEEIEKIAVKLPTINKTIERYARYRDDAVLNGGPELIAKYELALSNENRKKRDLLDQDKDWKRKKQEAEKQLNEKDLKMTSLGSIAEASLQLAGVFQAAQTAADLYIDEAKKKAEEIEAAAHKKAAAILALARAQARHIKGE